MIPLHDDNPTVITPFVTIGLIIACTVVFFWQLSLGPAAQKAIVTLGVIPATLFTDKSLSPEIAVIPAWMTVFTSMFMHGGWMHLIGNMLYLWIFGNNVEDSMGHARFIVFYLLCGVIAVVAHSIPDPDSSTPLIGASGALAGVLGAYLLLYPQQRFWSLFRLLCSFIPYACLPESSWASGLYYKSLIQQQQGIRQAALHGAHI